MPVQTPKSLKHGHENLSSELNHLIMLKDNIGIKAKALAEVMYPHFQKEEKYALPPLGLLLALSEGNWEIDTDAAIKMSELLQSKLVELKNEHEDIEKALKELVLEADKENNGTAKHFAKELMVHIEIEDQVLYPATILIGNYLKHLKLYPQ